MNYDVKNKLFRCMVSNGVDQATAEVAAQRCATAVYKNGVIGSLSLTAALVFLTRQPLVIIGAVPFGAVASAAGTLGASPSCQEVRNAALNWASSSAP